MIGTPLARVQTGPSFSYRTGLRFRLPLAAIAFGREGQWATGSVNLGAACRVNPEP